jgi:hypothetical protein
MVRRRPGCCSWGDTPARGANGRGLGKPETFDFLGFTHIVGTTRRGAFQLHRQTSRKKRRAKLARLAEECRERRHLPVAEQHRWLCLVLNGTYRYYAVPTKLRGACELSAGGDRNLVPHAAETRVLAKLTEVANHRGRWTVEKLRAFERRFPLPRPHILHDWPTDRFARR